MKKKAFLTTLGVLALSSTLLIGNAAAGSAIMNNMVKTEEDSNQGVERLSTAPLSHTTQTKESEAPASVPNLKVEPDVPVKTSEEYLENDITEEELQMIYDYMDNSWEEADTTRDQTDDEINRRRILKDQYDYDGLRPQSKLPLAKGNSDFCFDLKTQTYYLPDRALTDEELLQFIDWTARIDYAFNLRNEDILPQPGAKDITKEEAIAKAKDSFKTIFDVDVSGMDVVANFNESYPTNKGEWYIMFAPHKMETLIANKEAFWYNDCVIDSLTGDLMQISRWCSTDYDKTTNEDDTQSFLNDQSILSDDSWIEKAKNAITEKWGEKRKIKDAVVKISPIESSDDVENGKSTVSSGGIVRVVSVLITLEDDSAYRVTLSYPDQTLRNIEYTPDIQEDDLRYFD